MDSKLVVEIAIDTEYITLGQFLKFEGLIATGGEAKNFIISNSILVSGTLTKERGKKLRDGDTIEIDGKTYEIKSKK
jgi:S4 domain protein YaaA